MDKRSLIEGYKGSHGALMMNLKDIDDAASMAQPSPAGNCINWLVGHLMTARDGMMRLLGGEPFLTEEEVERYKRGSAPLKPAGEHVDIKRLIKGLIKTNKQAIAALDAAPEKLFDKKLDASMFPVPVEHATIGTMLLLLLFHEGYHTGQIGLARRVTGKSGAIA